MDIAEAIRSRLTTKEVVEAYGIRIGRNGMAKCPFHNDKSPSMKVYKGDGGFHCFACGKHGDTIGFVQEYFGLNFRAACAKINEDFRLGLDIDHKSTDRERLEAARRLYERRRHKEAQEMALKGAKSAYNEALDRYVGISTLAEKMRPKIGDLWPSADLRELAMDIWAEALHQLPLAEYKLEMAETRLYEVEHETAKQDCKAS